MIFFVDFGVLAVVVIAVILGFGYVIFTNISNIIWGIAMTVSFFAGVYVFFTGFKKKMISQKIATCIQGLMMMTVFLYISLLIDFAKGHGSFTKGNFIILDFLKFLKKDEFLACLTVSLVLLIVESISLQIGKVLKDKKMSGLCYVLSIILFFLIYGLGLSIALKDSFNNSIEKFDMESPKYEVTEDANIMSDFWLFFMKTGKFKNGTKLYTDGDTETHKNIDYIEVTDGKKMGYVPQKAVRELYTMKFIINTDTELYGISYEEVERETSFGTLVVSEGVKTENAIGNVSKGVQVKKEEIISENYVHIVLPDGTEGCVRKEYLDEVRVEN